MQSRESILPLTLGLVFAVVCHLGGAVGLSSIQRSADRGLLPPPPKPDLAVTLMKVSEPRVPGQPVTITATVHNAGKADVAAFALALEADEASVAELNLPQGLAADATTQQTFQYTAPRAAAVRLRVIADPAGRIAEEREDNNALEQTVVFRHPVSPSQGNPAAAPPADLSVFSLDVSNPRIVGDPSRVTIGLANLGGDISAPFEVQLLLDGKLVDRIVITEPLPGGSLRMLSQQVTVTEVGEHEVEAIADPLQKLRDRDRANNALARKFSWIKPGDDELKIGQLQPTTVKANWISYDDFVDLLARKAKFDQAAVQKSVHPDPLAKRMPLDPTPPAQNTPAVAAQPTPPPAPKSAEQMQQQQQAVVKPAAEPKPPVTTAKAEQVKPEEPKQAPLMPKVESKIAAAPVQGPVVVVPSEIKARGETQSPQLMTDNTPAKEPVAAPPPRTAPGKEVALITPPVQSNPAVKPMLPEPLKETKLEDKAQKIAPQLKPDEKSNPDDKTRRVDAPQNPPMLAVLPAPPRLADPAGSPQKEKPADPKARTETAPKKPVEPMQKEADGQQKKPAEQQPTPNVSPTAKPAPPATQPSPESMARPTMAPKTDREAPPVSYIGGLVVRPGRVLAQQGLQINTVQARFSTVALMTSVPNNPTAVITFNKAGEVIKAEFLRSTGYLNIDGPLLSSFYKWTARGDALQKVPATLTIEVRILLGATD